VDGAHDFAVYVADWQPISSAALTSRSRGSC
jgi:hypothetical protein